MLSEQKGELEELVRNILQVGASSQCLPLKEPAWGVGSWQAHVVGSPSDSLGALVLPFWGCRRRLASRLGEGTLKARLGCCGPRNIDILGRKRKAKQTRTWAPVVGD